MFKWLLNIIKIVIFKYICVMPKFKVSGIFVSDAEDVIVDVIKAFI